ncbi:LruC domain-containing protein [uncultured Draconibacterium sp.]|uniref:LruC domain-containing protein n=1 Tax=uncultured Draconibacterium sp. TaxID=1573823 RepID=UPI0032179FC5
MKNYLAILLVLLLGSCLDDSVPELTEEQKDEQLVLTVPNDFSWSNISGVGIAVDIKLAGSATTTLDNTVIELYDEDDVLLDALAVIDGAVEFNVRIPAATVTLKLKSVAADYTMEISADENSVVLNVPSVQASKFARIDTDNDGVFDAFDSNPGDANVAINITPKQLGGDLKSAQAQASSVASYVIFEDLWPSKGDYDFNDLVSKTTFSWTRGKSNYVEEISGVCSVEWIGAGLELGLGFELFEMKGTNLYYLDDVIAEIEGASEDNTVRNGFIVFNRVQNVGLNEVAFTLKIKDKEFKEFVCIPYLFRTTKPEQQVRPFGTPPTQAQSMAMFNTYDDASPRTWSWNAGSKFKYPLQDEEAFYRTKENHPWGIEFITKNKFKPSSENKTILKSYPKFRDWAESGGKNSQDWYDNPAE